MKRLLLLLIVGATLLTSCGIDGPAIEAYKPMSEVTVEPKTGVVKAQVELESGELGTFYTVADTAPAVAYTEDTVLVETTNEYLAMVIRPRDGKSLVDIAAATLGKTDLEEVIASETESLYKTVVKDDLGRECTNYVGVSYANDSTAWILYGWFSPDSPENFGEYYENAFTNTFSKRVFMANAEETDTTKPAANPNKANKSIYVPLGSSGYAAVFAGASEPQKTSAGWDIHLDSKRTVSIEDHKTGHADINISEAQLEYEDLQQTLLKDYQTLDKLTRTSGMSAYKSLDNGFWKSIDFTYMQSSRKTYARVWVIGQDYGFTTVVFKSNRAFDDKFFAKDFQIISESDRKSKAEYSAIPLATTVKQLNKQDEAALKFNPSAISMIRTVGGKYLYENFGDATYSQGYLSKQLYFKNNYTYALLPISSVMEVQSGAQSVATTQNSVYGKVAAPDAKHAKLTYKYFEASGNPTDTGVIDETVIGGFAGAADTALRTVYAEVKDNNYSYTKSNVSTSNGTWQGEYVYRAIDRQTNVSYNKNVYCYIKDLGNNCYFSAVLTYSDKAPKSDIKEYQTAFESTVVAKQKGA